MPEEEPRGVSPGRVNKTSFESAQESRQKPAEKKTIKQQNKTNPRPSTVRRLGDSQPVEELWVNEDVEANIKVNESFDKFIRHIRGGEPLGNLTRPEKTLQRIKPDVSGNHVAVKFSKSEPRDIATSEIHGLESRANDLDALKDASNGSTKGAAGLGRGSQHSLKVPHGVVAITQAAAKSDLQGWPSPSKVTLIKCEKCSREFCASLNYRRHVRVHRKSLNPEKEDLSKERPKVAAFWDKLSPEEASTIVHFENMEIEDLSGHNALKALISFIQQPGLPSLPQSILKAGAAILDIVQNKGSVFPLTSDRLLKLLDEASEKTFLCGGTSLAVQRFVFNGDAGKVGLEEKNLVASMGFHIELKLVKAWMADKEAEALRCQQALFKEEEAAQEKRAKLLEKKRLKKIRQKERKGGASQLILQELESESLDEDGNIQGIGEDDDSPTATASSAFSLASAQDLALPDASELDITEDAAMAEPRDDLETCLGEEPNSGKITLGKGDQFDVSEHRFMDEGRGIPRLLKSDNTGGGLERKEGPSLQHLVMEEMLVSLPRPPGEIAGDSDVESRSPLPSALSRIGRGGEVHSSSYFRKADQDRVGFDFKRRDSDRFASERKSSRNTRERSRNDNPESVQKLGRDLRGFDGRYVDGVTHTGFKPGRKTSSYFVKGDGGSSDTYSISRSHQYRGKLSGINRTLPINGIGQVVWTRKFPQLPTVDTIKSGGEVDVQEEIVGSKDDSGDGWELEEVSEVARNTVLEFHRQEFETLVTEVTVEDPAPLSYEDGRFPALNKDATAGVLMPEMDDGLSGALLVGSLSVPLGKFAVPNAFPSRQGPYSQHTRQTKHPEVPITCNPVETRYAGLNSSPGVVNSLGSQTGASGHEAHEASGPSVPVCKTELIMTQIGALKPHFSMPSPEGGEDCRANVSTQNGPERLAPKPGSWQTSVGRYPAAKVWRPVGMAGERPDTGVPGLNVSCGESAFQDGDASGRSESEKELSPKGAGQQSPPVQVFIERSDNDDAVVNPGVDSQFDDLSYTSAPLCSTRSLGLDTFSEGQAEYTNQELGDYGADGTFLATGLCSLSDFVEVAEAFFNERWRIAWDHASEDDVLAIEGVAAEGVSNDGINFLDMVLIQLSNQSTRHCPGAESLLSPSSVITRSLGELIPVGELSCRIFSDSGLTGVEDVRCAARADVQGLDETVVQESGTVPAVSSEDETRMRGLFEKYVSGSETINRSYIISSNPVGIGVDNLSEGKGDVEGARSSYTRHGHRHDKWRRYTCDKVLEQRYIPRRRVPSEKNC